MTGPQDLSNFSVLVNATHIRRATAPHHSTQKVLLRAADLGRDARGQRRSHGGARARAHLAWLVRLGASVGAFSPLLQFPSLLLPA